MVYILLLVHFHISENLSLSFIFLLEGAQVCWREGGWYIYAVLWEAPVLYQSLLSSTMLLYYPLLCCFTSTTLYYAAFLVTLFYINMFYSLPGSTHYLLHYAMHNAGTTMLLASQKSKISLELVRFNSFLNHSLRL